MSDKEELEKLKKTFEDFINLSGELQRSYELLKEESQQLSLYLSNILENMSSAILVFDNHFSLNLWNGVTRNYFPVLSKKEPPVALEELSQNSVIDIESILKGENSRREELVEIEVDLDGTRKWLGIDFSDFMNSKREKTGYLVVINDKTELKKLQLKSQQEERLRVMGELAAEVAHEIRNPLGSIELMVTLLEEDMQDNPRHKDILSRMRTSVDNMNHTVTNILLYTKEIHLERAVFPIAQLIGEAESIAWNTLVKKQIQVEKKIAELEIEADFELLKQSVANILINAAQAVDMNGRIDISAEIAGDMVKIIIKDTGCGIPPELKDKVFKPFFTTKTTGTGLGLAMVKRVIEAHSGRIYFESDTSGTQFFIEFPTFL